MDTTENYGTLTVKTESAFGALPVKDATGSFRRQTGDGAKLFAVLMTDEDGETEPLKIPAPPVSNSLSPGGETPYSLVNVEVFADGYYSVMLMGVPIFTGISSTQTVNMIPLPESYQYSKYPSGNYIITESEVPKL